MRMSLALGCCNKVQCKKSDSSGLRTIPLSFVRMWMGCWALLVVAPAPKGHAADLMVTSSVPRFEWTGLYIGGDLGYRRGDATTAILAGASVSAANQSVSGAIGSGVAGWNWEIPNFWNAGTMVVGTEVDASGSWARGVHISTVGAETFTNSLRLPWLTTIRSRLGIPFGYNNAWLIYGTAGVGFGRFESSSVVNGLVSGSTNGTSSRAVWLVGGGVEYAVNRYFGWKTEYFYIETGAVTNIASLGTNGVALSTGRIKEQLVRSGINVHF